MLGKSAALGTCCTTRGVVIDTHTKGLPNNLTLEEKMSTLVDVAPRQFEGTDVIGRENLERLRARSSDLSAKAMELTDAWGQAMFVLDRPLVERLFSTLGFSDEVAAGVYDGVRSLAYVEREQDGGEPQPEVTWHAVDATCLTLRGCVGLGSAMSDIDDESVEGFIDGHLDLFEELMEAMPSYARSLMFSPEVASVVIGAFGADLSADKLYELAATYGRQVTEDLEGRRGVSTQFVRSLTLTIAARI
jgi:hypothetical protein